MKRLRDLPPEVLTAMFGRKTSASEPLPPEELLSTDAVSPEQRQIMQASKPLGMFPDFRRPRAKK